VSGGTPIFQNGLSWRSPLFVNDAGKILIDETSFHINRESSGFPQLSIDWQAQQLCSGQDMLLNNYVLLDWGVGATYWLRSGTSSFTKSIDWANRQLCDKFGSAIFQWGKNDAFSAQEIKLLALTTDGFVKTSNSDGTLTVDTSTYLTAEADTLASVVGRGDNVDDNVAIKFGTSDDATITFDGNSLNIVANAVTATDAFEVTAGSALFTLGGGSAIRLLGAGTKNLFFGNLAGNTTASGNTDNIGIGYYALANLTSGDTNVAIGGSAGQGISTGIANTMFGHGAGYGTTGDYNVYIGRDAGFWTSSTSLNVGIGYAALYGTQNNSTGDYNTAIGGSALLSFTSGATNTAIGYAAGGLTSTASGCVFLGHYAGYRQNTSGLLIIDNQSRASAAVEQSNAIIYGVMAAAPANQSIRFNVDDFNISAGDADVVLTLGTGATNTGVLSWMEDEDYFKFSDDILLPDNELIKFGTGVDASIYYDGTNLLINPKAAGSGYLNIQGQTLVDDKILFTQTDGNEYIDSLADGYMDYGATTGHRFDEDIIVESTLTLATGSVTDSGSELTVSATSTIVDYGDSLIAHWKMNDNAASTDIVDNIGSYTATAPRNTSLMTTTGKISTALEFNGTTEYATVNMNTNLSGSFSFSCWAKPSDTQEAGADSWFIMGSRVSSYSNYWACLYILSNTSQYHFALYNGSQNPSLQSGVSYSAGTWVHLVGVRDTSADKIRIYVNGDLKLEATDDTASVPSYDSFRLGGQGDYDRQFKGVVDDARVYSKALTQEEITALYNEGNGTEEDGAVGAPAYVDLDASNLRLPSDSTKILLGAGSDWEIGFDGTNGLEDLTNGGIYKWAISGTNQIELSDGKLAPTTDDDVSLGDSTHRYKNLYLMPTSLYLGTSHITQDSYARNEVNGLLTAWRGIRNAGSAFQLLMDGVVDGFKDQTGVDTANSTYEVYDSSNDLYSPASTTVSVEVLVVAGGGGGGAYFSGGGGGGGGVVYDASYDVAVGEYTVTVGDGGTGGTASGGPQTYATNGEDSVFDTLTAVGGGYGGNGNGGATSQTPNSGGSGGGGGGYNGGSGVISGAAGTTDQGYAGGDSQEGYSGAPGYGAGGGGGAGAVGGNGTTTTGGNGGVGVAYDIVEDGSDVYYGGGGGGGASSQTAGTGGNGGGGTAANPGGNGTANTGGGGGGNHGADGNGGAGGSGVVIVRYLSSSLTATGGTITTDGDYTVHKFTADGTFEVTAGGSGVDNMTLISNAVTAEAAPSAARVMLLVDPQEAITINTDLKAYVSRDGTNYTQITLADEGSATSAIDILTGEATISSASGTSMKWKVETLNNKDIDIYGVGVIWK
jgi:hypothetical protein